MYNPRYAGASAQEQIYMLGRHFGYKLNHDGNCDGVAHSGLAALVTGKLPAFEEALAAISQVEVTELRYSTLQAYQQTRTRTSGQRNQNIQLALPAIKIIALTQDPSKYKDLFDQDSKESLIEQAINKFTTEKVILPKKIRFYGSFNRQGLEKTIEELQEHVKTLNIPFGFILFAADHAIAIGRDEDQWFLMDANSLPIKRSKNLKEVTDFIFEAFTFESKEQTDGFIIKFKLMIKESDQALFEKILLPWRDAQHAKRLLNFESLSKSEANRLFSTGVRNSDMPMLKAIDKDPRIDVGPFAPDLNCTMLYWAVDMNNIPMVEYLLEFDNIDVNLGCDAFTPLFLAAGRRYKEIVKLLLAHPSIDVDKKSNNLTAIEIARSKGYRDIVKLIRSHDQTINNNKKQKMSF
jgi:hypothetical protein